MILAAEELEIIALSLKVGIAAVLLSLPVAFGLAWLLARVNFPGKIFVDAIVHLPLVLPPVVTGWLLLIVFGNTGIVGKWLNEAGLSLMFRWTGAALAAAIMALPLMVRAIRLSLEAIDRRFENAARTLGASPWKTFLSITLPLSLPGILVACVLGFARSIGEFGATITFVSNIPGETRTLPIAIYSALQVPGGETMVTRLSIIAVIISLAALLLSEIIARRMYHGKNHHVI